MRKLSPAQLKGLEAAARGEVISTYTGSISTITGPVGSKTLWYLLHAGLIGYAGPKIPSQPKTPMVVTASGQEILSLRKKRERWKALFRPQAAAGAHLQLTPTKMIPEITLYRTASI